MENQPVVLQCPQAVKGAACICVVGAVSLPWVAAASGLGLVPGTVLGAAGFFRKNFLSGILAGGLLRYLCAFLSGVIFFAEYAPEGQSPFVYSLLYNASYMVPEILICMGIYLLPGMRRTVDMLKAQETAHAEGTKKA